MSIETSVMFEKRMHLNLHKMARRFIERRLSNSGQSVKTAK
jgi:hypothetical protein